VRSDNPLRNWQVDRSAIAFVGSDLQRPECILAEPDGVLWSADARGGVVRIAPDGAQRLIVPETVVPETGGEREASSDASFEGRYRTAWPSMTTATS
jgi:hypothetical protein